MATDSAYSIQRTIYELVLYAYLGVEKYTGSYAYLEVTFCIEEGGSVVDAKSSRDYQIPLHLSCSIKSIKNT